MHCFPHQFRGGDKLHMVKSDPENDLISTQIGPELLLVVLACKKLIILREKRPYFYAFWTRVLACGPSVLNKLIIHKEQSSTSCTPTHLKARLWRTVFL